MTKAKRNLSNSIIYIFLAIFFVISFFPVFFTFMSSFKSNMEVLTTGNTLIPKQFVFENYKKAWELADFSTYTKNSIFLSFFCVIGSILSSTICGYAFSRGKFKGKELIFYFMISSMFVSLGTLTLYPLLMIMKFVNLNKSLWGVIIIRVFGMNVTNLFIARGFVTSIPTEIDEAAKIDGCSFFGIYRRIIFPLCKPLVGTVAILSFRSSWNDYMLPMVFTMTDPKRMPLVVGIMHLKSSGSTASAWNLMLAGTAISLIPMIIIYIVFNRLFISGMTAGAVKG
ncbi:MAG: carbohydrate ABC transporter permease [Lachnospiraceae bacterium]|nr:carbohydrate ABC transporter permease [Lachnospiraceae bacterium]